MPVTEKELADLKVSFEKSANKNKEFMSAIASLEAEKTNLKASLEKAVTYNTDNFLINASKWLKKDKLTTKACRTKKLNITFDTNFNASDSSSKTAGNSKE